MSIYFESITKKAFEWSQLGDIKRGRGNLGEDMPILVYRLMQYTMLDVLHVKFGLEEAYDCFRDAGYIAGMEFSRNVLDLSLEFDSFIPHLGEKLKALKIGVLRIEHADRDAGEFILTVSEDLDCSGLSVTDENVCVYDEGFITGIFEAYTGKKYFVSEIDCWASGDNTCRFRAIQVI